ncbi:MAG: ATP-binding protein [Actinomycetota bacterium]
MDSTGTVPDPTVQPPPGFAPPGVPGVADPQATVKIGTGAISLGPDGLGLYRSPRDRVISGVAGGIGERIGVDPLLVRIAFLLLSLCAFFGVVLYGLLWALLTEDDGRMEVVQPGARRAASLAMILLGVMLIMRSAGLWLGDLAASSLTLIALGVGVLRVSLSREEAAGWGRTLYSRMQGAPAELLTGEKVEKGRLLIGVLLLGGGIVTFVARTDLFVAAPTVVLAVATTVAGLVLIFGPWGWRLLTQLSDERRERIRSQERAEMAAHLHDSVLQTLALIQRTGQPKEMIALARNQERELRAWLNGTTPRRGATLAGALQDAASAVELQFGVPVEVVTVGDADLADELSALVEATREAAVNAARHSGSSRVSVYMEVEDDGVTVFVRDQGCGFNPDEVAPGRRGVSESIVGRMERCGGSANICSEPGGGTEVRLSTGLAR